VPGDTLRRPGNRTARTVSVAREIAATMGWSHPYTLGLLHLWKMALVYCQAVVNHHQRIALDGAPAEAIDAEAKDLASKRLAQFAARKAVKEAAKTAAPTVAKPQPAPATAVINSALRFPRTPCRRRLICRQ
jgi:sRNA-binding protein